LKHFSAALTFTISNNQVVRELRLDRAAQEDLPIAVLHIDPSTVVGRLQRSVCEINELAEVVESHEPIQLDHDELQLLSFILNKKYEAAAIYEIDDYQEEDPFPIITVTESGVPYDIRTMSLGEISVFTIFWFLHRAQKNSLVLLEEPETFLSPVSQGAFLDYLASICVQKQLTLVLTTHSPQMFSRLSKDQVRFSYRTDVGAALADESQFDTMRHAVGISSQVDRIILVEDRAAREFVINVLRKTDHSFLLRSEVIDVGGVGKINRICETFPGGIKSFSMIGLYDGDVQAEVLALKPSWETVFLPGEKPIEEMFQQIIEIWR
jgi:AAA domain, putative AbiEii toxin, Type IV TA system